MKKHLGLGCVVLLVVAGAATASDNEGVGVSASVSASCTFTTLLSPTVTINPPFFPGEHNLGTLGYTCNFGHFVQFPSLNIQAIGGTNLVNSTDSHTVQYEVKWTVPLTSGPMPFQTSATTATFGPFSGAQGPTPNVEQTGSVIVKLQGDLTHAGTYADTLTFNISP